MSPLGAALLIVGAYLFGAIPWGLVLGRMLHQTDLREHGSKSTGTTNTYRVLGWRLSLIVLVLDIAKGALPVVIARAMGASWWVIGLAGVAATVGHCWSIYIRFAGGKGVATGAGAAIALFPWLGLLFFVLVGIIVLTRYVSLASLTGAVMAGALCVVLASTHHLQWATAVAVLAMATIIVVRHHENISRLLSGTERKLAWPPSSAGTR